MFKKKILHFKYICLLTSPLFHALQHEIINLIYLFVYTNSVIKYYNFFSDIYFICMHAIFIYIYM